MPKSIATPTLTFHTFNVNKSKNTALRNPHLPSMSRVKLWESHPKMEPSLLTLNSSESCEASIRWAMEKAFALGDRKPVESIYMDVVLDEWQTLQKARYLQSGDWSVRRKVLTSGRAVRSCKCVVFPLKMEFLVSVLIKALRQSTNQLPEQNL